MSLSITDGPESPRPAVTFLTSHGLTLLTIADDPDQRVRDLARRLDITERAVHRIIGELVDEGYLGRTRVGRRNHYHVNTRAAFIGALSVGDLLDALHAAERRTSPFHEAV